MICNIDATSGGRHAPPGSEDNDGGGGGGSGAASSGRGGRAEGIALQFSCSSLNILLSCCTVAGGELDPGAMLATTTPSFRKRSIDIPGRVCLPLPIPS